MPRLLEVGSVDLGGLGEKREIGNEAAADLSMMAGELQGLIGQFRYED